MTPDDAIAAFLASNPDSPAWPEPKQRDLNYRPDHRSNGRVTARPRNPRAFGGKRKFKKIGLT